MDSHERPHIQTNITVNDKNDRHDRHDRHVRFNNSPVVRMIPSRFDYTRESYDNHDFINKIKTIIINRKVMLIKAFIGAFVSTLIANYWTGVNMLSKKSILAFIASVVGFILVEIVSSYFHK